MDEHLASPTTTTTTTTRTTSDAARVALADLPGRPCPIAAALELVGERWALLVVREIWMGQHRFGEIVRGTGAPRDRVAARLKALEAVGVVERRPTTATRATYHLTAAGRDLVPVLQHLLAWGRAHAVSPDDPQLHLSHRHQTTTDATAEEHP